MMFGGIKALVVAGAIAGAAGGFIGWKARDAFCDAAWWKQQAELAQGERDGLRGQLDTQKQIADATRAERDRLAQRAGDLDEQLADYVEKLSLADIEGDRARAACKDPEAAKRLRGLR